jgi:uncharacterized sulfatase
MGWPDVACYGHPFHETPEIDRLRQQGMKFTDFYAGTPVCSSTRATIQSGQAAARVGITDFIPGHWRPFEKLVVPPIEHHLPRDLETPGEVLQKAGYATGHFGKWHLGSPGPEGHGYQMTAQTIDKAAFQKWRDRKQPGPKRIDLLTDQTLWFIHQSRERPFFVTLSHHAVHIPVEANPETVEKYRKKEKPEEGVNHIEYAAMIEDLDRSIGRIMDSLKEWGLFENTVVIFTSDNGGLRKIYTGVGEVITTNDPLRDEKGTLYEGGIRVPMIVRWPGVISAGSLCDEPATTVDLLPTFCEIAGAPRPDQPIDGTSLVPLFRNQNAELEREAIYFHYPHYHHSRPAGAIRMGEYKLIEFFDDTPAELYHLEKDISESQNLASEMPERVEKMRHKLAQWRDDVGARMPTKNPKYDPERADQWWSRRSKKRIDVEAMAKRYATRKKEKDTDD